MKNETKALLLAIVVYLPLIILMVQFKTPKPPKKNHYVPFNLQNYTPPKPKTVPAPKKQQPQKRPKPPLKNIPKARKKPLIPLPNPLPDRNITKSLLTPKKVPINQPKPPMQQPFKVPSLSQINRTFAPVKQPIKSPEVSKLYGDMLNELSNDQRAFLDDHLHNIGFITQQYLSFPAVAGELGLGGDTLLEFDLFPNGDIGPIHLRSSSGYALLDDNSKETVEIAYKDYPRPKTKTKIRLLVKYIVMNF